MLPFFTRLPSCLIGMEACGRAIVRHRRSASCTSPVS
jgi:hypothetical protein